MKIPRHHVVEIFLILSLSTSKMKNIGIIGNKRVTNFCNYRAVVEAVNANVVELDPYEDDYDLKEKMKEIDGLIIPGGLDIQPSYFHEKNEESRSWNLQRTSAYQCIFSRKLVSGYFLQ